VLPCLGTSVLSPTAINNPSIISDDYKWTTGSDQTIKVLVPPIFAMSRVDDRCAVGIPAKRLPTQALISRVLLGKGNRQHIKEPECSRIPSEVQDSSSSNSAKIYVSGR
jgi:hypothetical protein